ncbi:MAG: acetate kinase [Gemmatimonadales bacterium]|jgi:acetate kinase|nr:MAG: acetate kinase [Gemmatimonadales bacterium]
MNILVLNAGSSTLKFQLIATDLERIAHDSDTRLARGIIERIGGEAIVKAYGEDGRKWYRTAELRNLGAAVDYVLKWFVSSAGPLDALSEIQAVGHRVVHGGEEFQASVRITADVLDQLEDMIELAPLHNPHNLRAIEAVAAALGDSVPQVAVFDTAFHASMPQHAYLYAIPYSYYRRHRVRKYGFHGTSHRYVAHRWRQLNGRDRNQGDIITLHLGNGASACAIKAGESVDTSMGFTPLDGLIMGTRSGSVDPAILDYIAAKEGLSLRDVETILNKRSGLLGISGLTGDMRELLEEIEEFDDRRAHLAVEMFAYRARQYVGAYLAALGGAEAVVFTGGIGQNAPGIRGLICQGLEWAGLTLDEAANQKAVGEESARISTEDSSLQAWVIPTDEELLIARDTVRLVLGAPNPF